MVPVGIGAAAVGPPRNALVKKAYDNLPRTWRDAVTQASNLARKGELPGVEMVASEPTIESSTRVAKSRASRRAARARERRIRSMAARRLPRKAHTAALPTDADGAQERALAFGRWRGRTGTASR